MSDQYSQASTGTDFAQFTAALIAQTFDAIVTAQLDQEEKVRKLEEAAQMDAASFAREAVSLEEVETELARLFPAGDGACAVLPGSPYTPADSGKPEEPAIREMTGYAMTKADWEKRKEGTFITEKGHDNIVARIRSVLAAEQQANLIQMARRGIPRLMVDNGRVNTKLTFSLTQTEAPSTSSRSVSGQPATASLIGTAATRLSAGPITTLRLAVKPADLRRPEVARLSTNVVGEVEIVFKTVSE